MTMRIHAFVAFVACAVLMSSLTVIAKRRVLLDAGNITDSSGTRTSATTTSNETVMCECYDASIAAPIQQPIVMLTQ